MIGLAIVLLVVAILMMVSENGRNPDPAKWLRAAALFGVMVKFKATGKESEWTLGFALSENSENIEEIRKQALAMKKDGRRIDAIKFIRERLNMELKESKDFVDAL